MLMNVLTRSPDHRFGMEGLRWDEQTTRFISSKPGSLDTQSKYGSW